jgi:hypothetical protein
MVRQKAVKRDTSRSNLISRARVGSVTLVVGAGISLPFGIPNWTELAKRVWDATFPGEPSPWDAPPAQSPVSLPQFLPIIFERVARELNQDNDTGFVSALRTALYTGASFRLSDAKLARLQGSLPTIARTLAREYKNGGLRRIKRVVNFNVDALLETLTNRLVSQELVRPVQAVKPVSRAMQEPILPGSGSKPGILPIPVYHIHGRLPFEKFRHARYYEHRLVFTDSQYWASSSFVLSFANPTMGASLSDSCCVFIGTSMTDINILRWLALHNADFENDLREQELREASSPYVKDKFRPVKKGICIQDFRGRFSKGCSMIWSTSRVLRVTRYGPRHFWIRPDKDDPTGFLSAFLCDRAVCSVAIEDWKGASFTQLMSACFPAGKPSHKHSLLVH